VGVGRRKKDGPDSHPTQQGEVSTSGDVGGTSGGHLQTNKTIEKGRQRDYWLHFREKFEWWCQQCDNCAVSSGFEPEFGV
jgi:hypothetical protein